MKMKHQGQNKNKPKDNKPNRRKNGKAKTFGRIYQHYKLV
jgi:hypothetical protein